MAERYDCQICWAYIAGADPVLTKSDQVYCGDCWEMWVSKADETKEWAKR